MVRRLAAISVLVLAGLALSPATQAQGFFFFGETSPRDVVDRLSDQGYTVHLPMVRRGDVYVVDAVSSSRRPMRLIVSTRDGRVLERYATSPRWNEDAPRAARWHDDEADRAPFDSDEPRWERRTRTALGDPADFPPRARNRDGDFEEKPVPPAPLGDEAEKPKHHAKKHAPVVRETPDILPKSDPAVAAVAPSEPKPAKVEAPSPARVIEVPQAKAVAKPEPKPEFKAEPKVEPKPEPAPTSQVKMEDRPAPRVIPLTKPSPAPSAEAKGEEAPKPAPTTTQARSEDKPVAKPTPKPLPSAQAKVEEKPKAEVKPEPARKKLNDLPVGTLD